MDINAVNQKIAYVSQHGIALRVPYYSVLKSRRPQLKWLLVINFIDSMPKSMAYQEGACIDGDSDPLRFKNADKNWRNLLLTGI